MKKNSKNNNPKNYKLYRKMKKEQKSKRNLKKLRVRILRAAVIITSIQLIIVGVVIAAYKKTDMPVSAKNTETISFRADKVERRTSFAIGRFTPRDEYIVFYHNSEKYHYKNLFSDQYDGDNLVKDLENEYLTLTCIKGTKKIVALTGENISFYSLKDYNITATIRLILSVIVISGIEALFLFLVWIYIDIFYISSDTFKTIKKLKAKLKAQTTDEKKTEESSLP